MDSYPLLCEVELAGETPLSDEQLERIGAALAVLDPLITAPQAKHTEFGFKVDAVIRGSYGGAAALIELAVQRALTDLDLDYAFVIASIRLTHDVD